MPDCAGLILGTKKSTNHSNAPGAPSQAIMGLVIKEGLALGEEGSQRKLPGGGDMLAAKLSRRCWAGRSERQRGMGAEYHVAEGIFHGR